MQGSDFFQLIHIINPTTFNSSIDQQIFWLLGILISYF